ncbi:DUF4233 domain-containing protein [Nocardiopsis sp. LOL_012]|uniref:DUF4233 domain-containing protein n=1 Tax=Nocardiopsis sp. LOL_012 TaxID=3345409 RepID=UPI003A874B46
MRVICAVVLAFEAVVLGLVIPVAIMVEGMEPAWAVGVWGGMAAAALLLGGLQKYSWGHYAAWALQAVMVATSFLVPGMVMIAIVFGSLWVAGVVLGHRTDRMKELHAERTRADQPAGTAPEA